MDIKFFRGNDHQVKFKFKTFTGTPENIVFAVKSLTNEKLIVKKLNEGITKDDEWYVITFIPEDTTDINYDLKMKYAIKVIVDGKQYTAQRGKFILDDEVIRPADEV